MAMLYIYTACVHHVCQSAVLQRSPTKPTPTPSLPAGHEQQQSPPSIPHTCSPHSSDEALALGRLAQPRPD